MLVCGQGLATAVAVVFEKNLNAAKPPEQSKGLGGNIGCKILKRRKIRTRLDLLSIPQSGRKNVKTLRRILDIAGQLPGGLTNICGRRPRNSTNYNTTPGSDGWYCTRLLALQCRTQIIREQESDLEVRHLLQACRPAEHRLHCYVDHNSEAPGHNTFVSISAKYFVRCQVQPQ